MEEFEGLDKAVKQQVEQVIRVDREGKYVLILAASSLTNLQAQAEFLERRVRAWWESDDKFLILASTNKVDIRLERIDENDRANDETESEVAGS